LIGLLTGGVATPPASLPTPRGQLRAPAFVHEAWRVGRHSFYRVASAAILCRTGSPGFGLLSPLRTAITFVSNHGTAFLSRSAPPGWVLPTGNLTAFGRLPQLRRGSANGGNRPQTGSS